MPPLDALAVLRAAPDLYLLLSPAFRIVEVSDAYLRATMTRREDIVGRDVFEAFPDDPNDPGADGVASLRASLTRALLDRRPHAMPVQRYPIRRPESEGGGFEERFWSPLNTPVLEGAEVAYIIHRVEDVTERVRLERERIELNRTLGEATARSRDYGQLLDSVPDAIVTVNRDGRIELVNAQTEAMFGYARAELLGQPLEVLIPERFHARHAGHMGRYFANPTARPMGSRLQLFGRRKDASELPIEVSLSPQGGAGHAVTVSASIRDVTERVRLEAAARLTADRLRSAVDAIEDAFALFDAEDRLVLCNSVFRRLVHEAQPGALVGKRYAEILDAWLDDLDLPDAAARARFRDERLARRAREHTATVDVRLRDGRSLRVGDRRTAEGGIVQTVWDRTDDERRSRELGEARATAEAASAAKSDFLSSMSHELRTPLNAILGFAQLLARDKRQPLADRHRERVERIMSGGEHLLRLINDILDLSRIEAGRVSLSIEPVGLADVIDEVLRTLDPIAARQSIALGLDPLPASPSAVLADRTRFAQILMNFGSNAIKYNRPDGRVRFAVDVASPGRVRVTVSDTGIGIPLAQQEKIFQPFQRAGQEAGPIEGTGIGLTITRRLASLMAGTVGFRSEPGEGSSFWVELPAHVAADAPAPTVARPAEHPHLVEGGRHLVLYVEDNSANVVFMRDLMSSFDAVDLVTVPTAELGVELARARQPEVIIMDINLPGMSGLDALRALRADPETRRIPVIALTAAASERDRERGMEAGFYRYLAKPVKVDELIDAVESLLAPAP
ncbi:MAG: PAS domain S-box protein [Polyangiales bacterium]